MDKVRLAHHLKALIEENAEISITSNNQELDIDSFTMMLIITFTEEKIGVVLDMDMLDFDDFKSVNVLVNMIYEHKAVA